MKTNKKAPPSTPLSALPGRAGEEIAPTSLPALLATVIDDYLRWVGLWHRAQFYGQPLPAAAEPPASFARWRTALEAQQLAPQPIVARVLEDQQKLHELARAALARHGGHPGGPPLADYQEIIGTYEALMRQLRRVERASNLAASGIDPLTGLRTRDGLRDELERELERLRRGGEPFCLAIADIDHFKAVNDHHGHDGGDRVLEATAARIGQAIRTFDDAYRLGGEEFLLCLKRTRLEDAFGVLNRLRLGMQASPIPLPGGGTVTVTSSFGLVEAGSGSEIDDLLVAADKALYRAKEAGRNRIEIAG